jgi:hypothetical protein
LPSGTETDDIPLISFIAPLRPVLIDSRDDDGDLVIVYSTVPFMLALVLESSDVGHGMMGEIRCKRDEGRTFLRLCRIIIQ